MFRGSIPALITPFRDGKVDEEALAELVEWHVAEGSHGLVAGRHHRRDADAEPRGARALRRDRGRDRRRPHPGDRRRRVEQHRGVDVA